MKPAAVRKADQRRRDTEALNAYARENGYKDWAEMLVAIRQKYAKEG